MQPSYPSVAARLALLALTTGTIIVTGRAEQATLPAPVTLTAEQDHQRLMDLLHITALRPGADGFNKNAPNAQNTDEAKANPYPELPDPLTLNNGKKVTSAGVWQKQRRAEIFAEYDREIYGRVPKRTPSVKWEVTEIAKTDTEGIPTVTKTLVGHVDNSAYPAISVDIQMVLVTPSDVSGRVPVILEFGFPARPGTPPPPTPTEPNWKQKILAKGWGYAILDPTSVQADNGAGLTNGIIGLCNRGQPRGVEDWGALRAWAWGASRALDYFQTDKAVDAKQVGIEGLSRYGKATLVTMAYDNRFAIAFVGSSGAGGAKLWRRHWGEQEGNIASTGEYHWMAGNFLRYAGPLTPKDMPIDQHELIALCAPRPVFISCGSPTVEGTWLDNRGMYMAAVAAGPVYTLLGKKPLPTAEMPPMETALIDSDIAFRQHSGGHTNTPNWTTFLEYAGHYWKTGKSK